MRKLLATTDRHITIGFRSNQTHNLPSHRGATPENRPVLRKHFSQPCSHLQLVIRWCFNQRNTLVRTNLLHRICSFSLRLRLFKHTKTVDSSSHKGWGLDKNIKKQEKKDYWKRI